MARAKVPRAIFDYIAGGAEDEVTLRRNREAFGRWALRPRVLTDVSKRDTKTVLLGERVDAGLRGSHVVPRPRSSRGRGRDRPGRRRRGNDSHREHDLDEAPGRS